MITELGAVELDVSATKEFELFLLRLRYREGRLVEVEANKPFLLNEPDNAWVVFSGSVDVFAVPVQDGRAVGARSHIFRGEAGQLLLGMDLDHYGKGIGLLVSGMPETRVLKLRLSRLKSMAGNLEYRAPVAVMLEAWATGLLSGLSKEVVPKEHILLEAGQETVPRETQVAVPKRGLLWVRPLEGNAHFMGNVELGWDGKECYMPAASFTWLRPVDQTRLHAISTQEFVEQDANWTSLDCFHQLVLDAIVWNQEQMVSAERQRLQKKAVSERLVMENALVRLSSTLVAEPAAELVEIAGEVQYPLLTACQLIGHRLNLDIQTYPGMRKERSQKNMLMNIAKASRFRVREVALRGEWWRTDCGPLLGFFEESKRPVALLPTSSRSFELVDAVERTRTPVTPQVDARLSPFAYTFYRPFPNRALTAWDLMKFGLQEVRRDLFTVLLLSAAVGLLGLLPPLATDAIFNTIVPGGERGLLLQVGVSLFLIALAAGMFQITRSFAMLRVQNKMDASMQAAIWDRILSLPAPFFREYTSGDLGGRAMGITEIRRFLSGYIMTTILTSLSSVFSLALLFVYSVRLALVALLLVAIAVLATVVTGYFQVRYQRELSNAQGQVSGKVLQLITGVSKFRAAGAERRAFAIWSEGFSDQRGLTYKARSVGNGLLVFNAAYPALASMAIFAVVAPTSRSELSVGSFLAFNLAFTQFLVAWLAFSSVMVSIFMIIPIFERTKPILDALPEVDEYKADPGELTGGIEVSHVSFRYKSDGPLILKDVSVRIRPGEFVALVGPSGSGKSTLMRLLLGFETPESGGVYYDGQDLFGLDLRAVRQQIGVVLQSAKVMSGEIYDNIVGSSPYLTLDDAWEAARMAGLDEDIRAMPMGMNTVVSEGGGNLSGGQRQRLLIARAIVNKPRVLFFDEATSALDNETQEIVSRSLEGLQVTRIVIAHRLSTIINADRIYVFDSGQIVQAGTYEGLINRPGPFSELAKRQLA
jgi:NHLM bacteriocin system ABC transporter ATP-binding protein